jgi:hypothetical protein
VDERKRIDDVLASPITTRATDVIVVPMAWVAAVDLPRNARESLRAINSCKSPSFCFGLWVGSTELLPFRSGLRVESAAQRVTELAGGLH